MKKSYLSAVVATAALILGSQQAQALTAQLRLDDPNTVGVDQLILDNGAGDSNPVAGAITYIGAVGSFSLSVSTGLSAPVTGGPFPHLDLNSVSVTSSGAGILDIAFTDVDQSAANLGMYTHVGGTMSGPISSVTFNSYLDDSNVPFGTGTPVNSFTFTSPAYSGSGTGPVAVTDPYSATITARIVSQGEGLGIASFDLEFMPTPDAGGTAMLLGLGLIGMGTIARRKA